MVWIPSDEFCFKDAAFLRIHNAPYIEYVLDYFLFNVCTNAILPELRNLARNVDSVTFEYKDVFGRDYFFAKVEIQNYEFKFARSSLSYCAVIKHNSSLIMRFAIITDVISR